MTRSACTAVLESLIQNRWNLIRRLDERRDLTFSQKRYQTSVYKTEIEALRMAVRELQVNA